MTYLIYAILIFIVIFFVNRFLKRFKIPKIGAISLVTGGVKCGKSTFAVAMAISEYKRRRRSWRIRKVFQIIFHREISEEPLLYSNIPLKIPYVPVTEDLIFRKKRFRYGSVVYICEASLLADSLLIKDMELNERLMLFNKLIGHETLGGCLIYDTHCIVDNHYSVKRCTSEYFYIHHLTKWIPFFLLARVQECRFSEDNSTITTYDKDVELSLRSVILRKRVWKYFDAYCFSSLTDNLPVEDRVVTADDLKVRSLVSFRDFKTLPAEFVQKIGTKKIDKKVIQIEKKDG